MSEPCSETEVPNHVVAVRVVELSTGRVLERFGCRGLVHRHVLYTIRQAQRLVQIGVARGILAPPMDRYVVEWVTDDSR